MPDQKTCDHMVGKFIQCDGCTYSATILIYAHQILNDAELYYPGEGPDLTRAELLKLERLTVENEGLFAFCPRCGLDLTEFHLTHTFKP